MLRAMRLSMFLLVVACVACTDPDDSPPPRDLTFQATIDDSGLSEEVSFRIPEHTRSVTIVAEGAPDALLALGTFAVGHARRSDHRSVPSGATTDYPDPIDDTVPGVDNLMDNGTALSA
jgi:hypothetical protein